MERLAWGLVGGGEDSQIGFAHRAGATLDRRFEFVAGALDIDPDKGREYAGRLGLSQERAYGDWREMLGSERIRDDRPHLVTVATPNATHFEISKSFIEAGFHVLCEKPLTMNPDTAWELCSIAKANGRILAVNYGYSGYPMLRQIKAMVRREKLGRIRVVVAEFAGGFHADARDMENPRVKWRFDPDQVGVSSITGDAGIHALHAACFADRSKRQVAICGFRDRSRRSKARGRFPDRLSNDGRGNRSAVVERARYRKSSRPDASGFRGKGRASLGAGASRASQVDSSRRANPDSGKGWPRFAS